MKRNTLHIIWAATLLSTACTQEEFQMPGSHGGTPIAITVTDSGFKGESRADENGYSTRFTPGDECGLYIVRGGAVVCDNVKLTATAGEGTAGSLTWHSQSPIIGGAPDESYFLYYPYQADMTSKTDASADDAEGFFAQLVDGWKPQADQSRYANYTTSDLMTAKGSITKEMNGTLSLSFAMTHRMAMAVIEMPKTVYRFTNTTDGAIPDYIVTEPVDFTDSEIRPYVITPGTYRCIVKPGSDAAARITGRYIDGWKEFIITPTDLAASGYKTYKVDGAETTEKEHELQPGDYLLADGSLVSKNETLTPEQLESVSAIVFWTPSETDPTDRITPANLTDDKIMAAEHPHCTHGLAVAIRKAYYNGNETVCWQTEHAQGYDPVNQFQNSEDFIHPYKRDFVSIASGLGEQDNINRIYGYQNTVVIRAFNEYCTANGKSDYIIRPVAALDRYSLLHPAPANSTGWFLPSLKELHMLCYQDADDIINHYGNTYPRQTLQTINHALLAAGCDILQSEHPYDVYSSSSEYTGPFLEFDYVFAISFREEYHAAPSNYQFRFTVMAVCAF